MTISPETHTYALVQDGVVVNVVLATADFITAIEGHERIDTVTPRPGIGWSYKNKKWTPPAPDRERVAPQFHVTLDGLLPG